ncbi:MAG: hypothetical protein AAGD12_06865 [Pseudomonadota bacterium]
MVFAVNGRNVSVGEEITLPSGALLTLTADGSLAWNSNGQFADLDPDETTTVSFTYTIWDGTGTPRFPGQFDLADLGVLGFTLRGVASGNASGSSVSSAGDVNGGCGFDDAIIGACGADLDGRDRAGES